MYELSLPGSVVLSEATREAALGLADQQIRVDLRSTALGCERCATAAAIQSSKDSAPIRKRDGGEVGGFDQPSRLFTTERNWAGMPPRARDYEPIHDAVQVLGRPIRVGYTAVQVAAYLALTELNRGAATRATGPLDIVSDGINGREVAHRIGVGRHPPDIVFVPGAPMFFSGSPLVGAYSHLLVINRGAQGVLRRRGEPIGQPRLWYCPGSTSHLQLKVSEDASHDRYGSLDIFTDRAEYESIAGLRHVLGTGELRPGDYLLQYLSIARRLCPQFGFEPVKGTDFSYSFSMFYHPSMGRDPRLRAAVDAVANAFIATWNRFQLQPCPPSGHGRHPGVAQLGDEFLAELLVGSCHQAAVAAKASPPSFEAELAGGESESEPTPSQLSGRSTSPASMTSELMVTPPAYRFAEVNPHPPKSGRDPHLPTDDNLQRFAAEFPDAADAKLRHPDQNDGGGGLHRPSCLGRWSHVGILEQSGDSHVTGREMQALRDVLCDAFTEQSFREMLLFSWDKDLEDLSEEGTLPERVLSVIQSARREGWLDDFVRSAAEANPGNPALRAFRSTYADAQSRRGDKGAAQPSHKPEPAQPGGAAGPQVNRADRNLPSGGKTPGTEQSGRGNAVGHIFVSYSHEDADLAGTRRSGALVPAAETDLAVVLAARVPEELALMVSLKLRESPEDIAAAAREPHLTGPVLLRWAQERGRLGELRAAVSAWDRERPAASAVEHQRRPAASAVGHQRRLRRALLDQFPHPEDLTILLADSLDVHLDHVAGGGNQTEVCFNLVRWLWVDKVNRLRPLLDLAAEERPKSGELATLKRELSAD